MHAKKTLYRTIKLVSGALALSFAACSRDSAPPRQASDVPEPATPPRAPISSQALANPTSEATVQASPEIQTRCELPSSPQEVPRFDYDEATLRTRGANILDDVARCLSEGPLKGETITIIGRADPRGSIEYNHELGASRAEAARNYLEERGISQERLRLLSRGEQGARGHDQETWALDRRVDLELGDWTEPGAMQSSTDPQM